MSEYDDTNRGALFKNQRKEKETQPDMTGSLDVEGVEYWVSAWTKVPKAGGDKFLSISIQPKDGNSTQPKGGDPYPDDDLPF